MGPAGGIWLILQYLACSTPWESVVQRTTTFPLKSTCLVYMVGFCLYLLASDPVTQPKLSSPRELELCLNILLVIAGIILNCDATHLITSHRVQCCSETTIMSQQWQQMFWGTQESQAQAQVNHSPNLFGSMLDPFMLQLHCSGAGFSTLVTCFLFLSHSSDLLWRPWNAFIPGFVCYGMLINIIF